MPKLVFKIHSLREIAKIMNCSKSTVARELKKADKKVAENDPKFMEGLIGCLTILGQNVGQKWDSN
jgi:predicted DNA-binding protein (UPF0251 family)